MTSFLYIKITGLTATFKMPHIYSSSGIRSSTPTLTMPSYSTILGMLGNILGRELNPQEVKRFGYTFDYDKKNIDLEILESYSLDSKKDKLKRNLKPSNPSRREFLSHPTLHLYLENIDLFLPYIKDPQNIPYLGRSQDIAWIETLEDGKQYQIVESKKVAEGIINNTIIPFTGIQANGMILPIADYYDNSRPGFTRKAVSVTNYQLITTPTQIRLRNLYEVSNLKDIVIYMHKLPINKLLN